MVTGFEPVYDENSKVLILGSFPSVKSREINFYYGHPRNRFWRIMEKAAGIGNLNTIEEKKRFLINNRIALWDIVMRCEIKGSSDSSKKISEVADIKKLMGSAAINKIICNGKTAYGIFIRNFPEYADITQCLPSTSPANFKFDENMWLSALSELFE